MKKIFAIEINEKDIKFRDELVVERINNLLSSIASDINNEKEVFIKFKRIGNTWDDIISNSNKNISKEKIKKKNDNNHLKLIN